MSNIIIGIQSVYYSVRKMFALVNLTDWTIYTNDSVAAMSTSCSEISTCPHKGHILIGPYLMHDNGTYCASVTCVLQELHILTHMCPRVETRNQPHKRLIPNNSSLFFRKCAIKIVLDYLCSFMAVGRHELVMHDSVIAFRIYKKEINERFSQSS